jgi:hypothetical protein
MIRITKELTPEQQEQRNRVETAMRALCATLTDTPDLEMCPEMLERLLNNTGHILLDHGYKAHIPAVIVEAVGLYADGQLYATHDTYYTIDYFGEG